MFTLFEYFFFFSLIQCLRHLWLSVAPLTFIEIVRLVIICYQFSKSASCVGDFNVFIRLFNQISHKLSVWHSLHGICKYKSRLSRTVTFDKMEIQIIQWKKETNDNLVLLKFYLVSIVGSEFTFKTRTDLHVQIMLTVCPLIIPIQFQFIEHKKKTKNCFEFFSTIF